MFDCNLFIHKIVTPFSVLYFSIIFSQEIGSKTNASIGNWSNITAVGVNQSKRKFDLINRFEKKTKILLTIDDAFDTINNSGTQSPASNLIYTSTPCLLEISFGKTSSFNRSITPTDGFFLSNLET